MRRVIAIDNMRGAIFKHPACAGTFGNHLDNARRIDALTDAKSQRLTHRGDMHPCQ